MNKKKLMQRLIYLRDNFGMVGIKGGTEVEDLTFEEILLLRKISKGIMPLTVKIGGPEARNDIRFLLQNGIDVILGPMIESVYGLKNFIDSLAELENYYQKTSEKAINIETITAYKNLDEIYQSIFFKQLSNITVGRSDLSSSMGKTVDDPEVMTITKDIVKKSQELGKITSVGGKITVKNIDKIKNDIQPELINTRHIVFDLKKSNNLKQSLIEGLLLEVELYKEFKQLCPSKKRTYDFRIQDTLKRAGLTN